METFSIYEQNCRIEADFYPAEQARGTILYFHGGGFLYGVRTDLPAVYREMIREAGFHLLCVDYLLAPESSLSAITESAFSWVRWYLNEGYSQMGLTSPLPYFLFGRSAGAYLALNTARRIDREGLTPPVGQILFYGYSSLLEPAFSKPNPYYAKMPAVSEETAKALCRPEPISSGPLETRFSLYIYGRQQGLWISLCGSQAEAEALSLSPEELSRLSPAFLTASSTDNDVPFGCSKRISRAIPGSRFVPVYNLDHDFDRDSAREENRQLYRQWIEWADEKMK